MAVLWAALFVLPGRQSVPYGLITLKTKKRTKTKLGIDVPGGMSKGSANFRSKRSKVKVTGYKKPPESGAMFTYGHLVRRRQIGHRLRTKATALLGLISC